MVVGLHELAAVSLAQAGASAKCIARRLCNRYGAASRQIVYWVLAYPGSTVADYCETDRLL